MIEDDVFKLKSAINELTKGADAYTIKLRVQEGVLIQLSQSANLKFADSKGYGIFARIKFQHRRKRLQHKFKRLEEVNLKLIEKFSKPVESFKNLLFEILEPIIDESNFGSFSEESQKEMEVLLTSLVYGLIQYQSLLVGVEVNSELISIISDFRRNLFSNLPNSLTPKEVLEEIYLRLEKIHLHYGMREGGCLEDNLDVILSEVSRLAKENKLLVEDEIDDINEDPKTHSSQEFSKKAEECNLLRSDLVLARKELKQNEAEHALELKTLNFALNELEHNPKAIKVLVPSYFQGYSQFVTLLSNPLHKENALVKLIVSQLALLSAAEEVAIPKVLLKDVLVNFSRNYSKWRLDFDGISNTELADELIELGRLVNDKWKDKFIIRIPKIGELYDKDWMDCNSTSIKCVKVPLSFALRELNGSYKFKSKII